MFINHAHTRACRARIVEPKIRYTYSHCSISISPQTRPRTPGCTSNWHEAGPDPIAKLLAFVFEVVIECKLNSARASPSGRESNKWGCTRYPEAHTLPGEGIATRELWNESDSLFGVQCGPQSFFAAIIPQERWNAKWHRSNPLFCACWCS